jgi:ribonuclease HI
MESVEYAMTTAETKTDTSSNLITIYTDGACIGNPGKGGWGVVIRYPSKVREIYGGDLDTTNNRMELQAAIEALARLEVPNATVRLHTDSQYVRMGITEWIHGWKLKGWKDAKKKPIKNQDLWHELDRLNALHDVEWVWVKGHSGDAGNERADALANRGAERLPSEPRWRDLPVSNK